MAAAALVSVAVSGASSRASQAPPYTRPATRLCLLALPNAVAGLPPATPPVPPALFVYSLKRDDVSTGGPGQTRPRLHTQLGAWFGHRRYEGIILSFFKSVPAARASRGSLAWLYGGKLVRNVVVTWDQTSVPSRKERTRVLRCLRSRVVGKPAAKRVPPASLATFAGRWGGRTRGLAVTSSGRGRESADDGCCTPVYELRFRIVSVRGSLTRATAVFRVTSFRRYNAASDGSAQVTSEG